MNKTYRHEDKLKAVTSVLASKTSLGTMCHLCRGGESLPAQSSIQEIIDLCRAVLFPGFYGNDDVNIYNLEYFIGINCGRLHKVLSEQIAAGLVLDNDCDTTDYAALERDAATTAAQFIEAIKAKYPEQLVMADCATIEEGIACANARADFVGTTMRGYTPETQGCDDMDFDFIHELSEKCPAKIIAEGHIHYPEQAKKALEAGAFARVVGGAITRPAEITARFVAAIEK